MKDKKQIQIRIINSLRSRLEGHGIKPASKKGLQEQAIFLCGAMSAIEAIYPNEDPGKMSEYTPPIWVINIMSGRSTIE